MPFICLLCRIPGKGLGLAGAFVSSETFAEARKLTGSFVFIATQTAFPGSWDPENDTLRAGLLTGVQGALRSAGPSQEAAPVPGTLSYQTWLQRADHRSVWLSFHQPASGSPAHWSGDTGTISQFPVHPMLVCEALMAGCWPHLCSPLAVAHDLSLSPATCGIYTPSV